MPTLERTPIAQRPQRSPKDLQEALAVHVRYEVTACAEYAQRLATHYAKGDRDEEIAYLETVLLHARALHEFLIKSLDVKPRLEDMLRTDFGSEWDPLASEDQSLRRAATALDEAVPDTHKHLVHLTWPRVEDPGQAVWQFVDAAQQAAVVVGAWARHVQKQTAEKIANEAKRLSEEEVEAWLGVRECARTLAEIGESRAADLADLLPRQH